MNKKKKKNTQDKCSSIALQSMAWWLIMKGKMHKQNCMAKYSLEVWVFAFDNNTRHQRQQTTDKSTKILKKQIDVGFEKQTAMILPFFISFFSSRFFRYLFDLTRRLCRIHFWLMIMCIDDFNLIVFFLHGKLDFQVKSFRWDIVACVNLPFKNENYSKYD